MRPKLISSSRSSPRFHGCANRPAGGRAQSQHLFRGHHARRLAQAASAQFVGTEPGNKLDTWAEGGNVDLPNSRLRMHYADMAHRYSALPLDVPKNLVLVDWNVASLAPDVAADWNWADYVAGRDPYSEAALGSPLVCPR